jgi:hypothetical protein
MSVWLVHQLVGLQVAKLKLLEPGVGQTMKVGAKVGKRIVVILIKVESATAETQTM